MNLRVDLILPTEQRSASPLSPKSLLRIVLIVVPAALVLYLISQFLVVKQLDRDLRDLRLSFETAKPQQERARQLMTEFEAHRRIETELQGWRNSRIAWHEQLTGVLQEVPAGIQLEQLNISQRMALNEEQHGMRTFLLTMRGKAVGDTAEADVRRLESEFSDGPVFGQLTERVEVPQYGADMSSDASRNDRVFQMTCEYKARAIE
jgi:hypothetical protein